jgi:hypothetical protein
VVESTALEMRRRGNPTGGSNPSLSATYSKKAGIIKARRSRDPQTHHYAYHTERTPACLVGAQEIMSVARTQGRLRTGQPEARSLAQRILVVLGAILGIGTLAFALLPTLLLQLVAPATAPGGSVTDIKRISKTFEVMLEFDVDGTRVSGSGVMRNWFRIARSGQGPSAGVGNDTADAIPMRLPNGDVLVATLTTPDESRRVLGYMLTESCGLPPSVADGSGEAWLEKVSEFGVECAIDPSLFPVLVLFPAPPRPDNAIYVDPAENSLGVRFVRGSISVAEGAAPTDQIRAVLPWLDSWHGILGLANEDDAPLWIQQLGIQLSDFIRR